MGSIVSIETGSNEPQKAERDRVDPPSNGIPAGEPPSDDSGGGALARVDWLAVVPDLNVTLRPSSRIVAVRGASGPAPDRFRYLRMRMDGLRTLGKLHTVTITSALPKDGKSTIALNLATILAEGDRNRVLLIEADLHCPSCADFLGVGRRPGLAECLEGGADPLRALRRIQPLGWYLLPAGTALGNPSDLLQPPLFPAVVDRLAPFFDWVLIDTPPVLPVTDALAISQHTDGTILVVRADATPKATVDEAVALLSPSRIAAIIFNAADELNHKQRRYNYSSYYRDSSNRTLALPAGDPT